MQPKNDLSTSLTKMAVALSFCVVPIYQDDANNRPQAVGSALLINHLGRPYLATAAHVITKHVCDGPLYFYSSSHAKSFIVDSGLVLPKAITRGQTPIDLDIALFPLITESRGSILLEGKSCLPSHSLTAFPHGGEFQHPGNRFLVTGFPATKSKLKLHKKELQSEMWSLLTRECAAAVYNRAGIDPRSHLLISLNEKDLHQNGKRIHAPDLNGVSGSPVWCMWNDNEPIENQTTENLVAGFATDHLKEHKAMLAVRAGAVEHLLREATTLRLQFQYDFEGP
jgi:hypothetical protein